MLKLHDYLLVVVILLHHLYIVFLNTSSVHGLFVPDKAIWSGVLVLFLLVLTYYHLKEPVNTWYEKALYVGIILGVTASILRIFSISFEINVYAVFLVIIALLSVIPLVVHPHNQLRVALLGIYSLEIIVLMTRVVGINNVIQILGPMIEIGIVLGIIYYNYSLGFAFDELFIIIVFTLTGWYLGDFIYSFDVPTLIVSILFEQTLSVGQYAITGIEPKFFLSLHMAEVFNILIVQFLTRRSWHAMAIIATGLDMTYPPLLTMRAILILIFLRKTVTPTQDQQINQTSEEPVVT